MRGLTIGWRLTIWYGAVLAVSLFVFAGIVYATFARNLLGEIDRALAEELAELETAVRQAPDREALAANLESNFGGHEFYEIQVLAAEGAPLFRTSKLAGGTLPLPAERQSAQITESAELTGLGPFRVATREVKGPAGTCLIQAADSLALYQRELRELMTVLLSAVPVILAFALVGGAWLSRRALAPVDRLRRAALEISATKLGQRVEVINPHDELGRLAEAFNGMIGRLEKSFDEMRRFTADAAHELRTPLAVLRNEAEVTLRAARAPDQYQHVLANQLEEIGRLTRLAEELLFLCREDAGLQNAPRQSVPIDCLLEQLVSQLQTAAQARDVRLTLESIPSGSIGTDPDRLRRLFFNLIDNALKYTPPGGAVSVRGVRQDDLLEVVIADSGIGIPAEHLPHVCERFYRVDPARSRQAEGTGLGLAICRAIVEAHKGTLRVESEPGSGTRVEVTLPVDPIAVNVPSSRESSPLRPRETNIPGSSEASGDGGVRVKTQSILPAGGSAAISHSR